jgi:magnesium-transporting ATPase (P-type)
MLLVFSLFQLGLAFYSDEKWSWLQAVSVAFAVLFACIIASACDYAKQKQQLRLVAEIKNEKCNVIRGASGTTSEVYVSDLVVGDVVLLDAGDRVPADCILIEEMDMFVDQADYYPSQADTMRHAEKQSSKKDAMGQLNHLENPDIVVLQNSIVMAGAGKALVCAVGKGTLNEKEMTKNELLIEEVNTPLQ